MVLRKNGGIRSRVPTSLDTAWAGTIAVKPSPIPSHRTFRRKALRSVLAFDADAVKFHPMVDEAIAELLGDLFLERLEFGIDEFEHLAALDVDQVIVMGLGRRVVAGAAIAEIVTIEDARFLEQPDGAVHRGDRDLRVDRGGTGVQRLDVGMILRVGQDPCDDTALLGDPQAPLCAERFEIDGLVQGEPHSNKEKRPATMVGAGRFFNCGRKSYADFFWRPRF